MDKQYGGELGEPIAVKTKFGWVLSGPLKGERVSSVEIVTLILY